MKVSEDVSLSTKVELGLDNDSIFWKTRKKNHHTWKKEKVLIFSYCLRRNIPSDRGIHLIYKHDQP